MSLRVRVLAMIGLVALIAIAATAWLTQWHLSRQFAASAAVDRQTNAYVTSQLVTYARTHGTWEGVAGTVSDLHRGTGLRIRLVTRTGEVVTDSDTLAGRAARPPASPPISVDAVPSLQLPDDPVAARDATVRAIATYRVDILAAACLTRNGLAVVVFGTQDGVPRLAAEPAAVAAEPEQVNLCAAAARDGEPPAATIGQHVDGCRGPNQPPTSPTPSPPGTVPSPSPTPSPPPDSSPIDPVQYAGCLQDAFAQSVNQAGLVPLYLYLGAIDDQPQPLSPSPSAAAALVAVLSIAATALLSRRVLRPITALTSASQRLGEGDLRERVPVVGRDELARLAGSFNRMADSLQRGEERQRRMVADVAHELRTPLANLRGYLEALKDGVMEPDRELFASLYEEAVLQQRIVDDLQDLALAEAGRLTYRPARVDVRELLETCRSGHHAVADAAGVALVVSTGEAQPPVFVHIDADRLRQVVNNLMTNAVRATLPGGTVTLAVTSTDRSVAITVTDTGRGISADDLPHVFDRFWRADAARSRSTGGSGLGLAIAQHIVADHHGTIHVASTLGAGTTFTITLPAE